MDYRLAIYAKYTPAGLKKSNKSSQILGRMREIGNFDLTIICDDGTKIPIHYLVLAAVSMELAIENAGSNTIHMSAEGKIAQLLVDMLYGEIINIGDTLSIADCLAIISAADELKLYINCTDLVKYLIGGGISIHRDDALLIFNHLFDVDYQIKLADKCCKSALADVDYTNILAGISYDGLSDDNILMQLSPDSSQYLPREIVDLIVEKLLSDNRENQNSANFVCKEKV